MGGGLEVFILGPITLVYKRSNAHTRVLSSTQYLSPISIFHPPNRHTLRATKFMNEGDDVMVLWSVVEQDKIYELQS